MAVIYRQKDPLRQLREGLKISRNVTKTKLAVFVTRFKIKKTNGLKPFYGIVQFSTVILTYNTC